MRKLELTGNYDANSVEIGSTLKLKGECIVNFWRNSKNNIIHLGNNCTLHNLKVVFKGHNSELIVGDNVRLTGNILITGSGRKVHIGNNSTAQGVYILSRDADVFIGKDCMFSREIEVRSTDVHKIYDLTTSEHLNPGRNVIIGDRVWVGAKALISKGANIPNGSIVGACSFVNKEFDKENVIIAGSPAKVVKYNIRWER